MQRWWPEPGLLGFMLWWWQTRSASNLWDLFPVTLGLCLLFRHLCCNRGMKCLGVCMCCLNGPILGKHWIPRSTLNILVEKKVDGNGKALVCLWKSACAYSVVLKKSDLGLFSLFFFFHFLLVLEGKKKLSFWSLHVLKTRCYHHLVVALLVQHVLLIKAKTWMKLDLCDTCHQALCICK